MLPGRAKAHYSHFSVNVRNMRNVSALTESVFPTIKKTPIDSGKRR